MQRRDLHLNGLRAFESAARHGTLTKAAEELGVTHAAVSHQIKHLEGLLGLKLFNRCARGMEMTVHARSILPVLTDSFDRITAALDALATETASQLTVTTTPVFASHWLIPRLSKWQQNARDSTVHVLPTLGLLDLARGEADVAIRCGVPNWGPDLICEKLVSVTMTPVCSRGYLEHAPPLRTARDLARHTLIHADVDMTDAGYEWREWLAAAGAPKIAGAKEISFHDPGLAVQAALNGLGLAMGYIELLETEFEERRLVQPFDIVAVHPFSYHLVHSKASAGQLDVRNFIEWTRNEIGVDARAAGMG